MSLLACPVRRLHFARFHVRDHLPPEKLVADILAKERRIAEIIVEIKQVLAEEVR